MNHRMDNFIAYRIVQIVQFDYLRTYWNILRTPNREENSSHYPQVVQILIPRAL